MRELDKLKDEHNSTHAIIIRNTSASEGIDWLMSQNIKKKWHRGIAFLDPFGANLDWVSVEKLARTGLFEVVVNFTLNMAIVRMMPNSGVIPKTWELKLDALFGDHRWHDVAYEIRRDFFGQESFVKRSDYVERLLSLYCSRLKDAFGHVSSPRLIRNTRNAPLYYLIWAGPHSKGLKGAEYILTMGERLSHSMEKPRS